MNYKGSYYSTMLLIKSIILLLLNQSVKGQKNIFSFDELQRLTSISYSNGLLITYHYDANGNRISQTIGITPGVNMDVTIQTPSLASTSIVRGNILLVNGVQTNIGSTATVQHYVRFFLSSDNILDANDVQLDQSLVGNLGPGSSFSFANRSLTIPANTVPGNYFILFAADGGNHLAEINEANNVSALPIEILAAAVYTFTGSGNFNNAANWSGGNRPPNPLPSGQTIIINGSGECILNVPQTISRGANLRVEPGKRFRVNGNLTILGQ